MLFGSFGDFMQTMKTSLERWDEEQIEIRETFKDGVDVEFTDGEVRTYKF